MCWILGKKHWLFISNVCFFFQFCFLQRPVIIYALPRNKDINLYIALYVTLAPKLGLARNYMPFIKLAL
jgi:hypothetical protein